MHRLEPHAAKNPPFHSSSHRAHVLDMYIHTYIHTHTHIYIHTHIHVRTLTYTQNKKYNAQVGATCSEKPAIPQQQASCTRPGYVVSPRDGRCVFCPLLYDAVMNKEVWFFVCMYTHVCVYTYIHTHIHIYVDM